MPGALPRPSGASPGLPAGVPSGIVVIACGAIAHELVRTLEAAGLAGAAAGRRVGTGPVRIECLPADFHDTPERIVPAVAAKLDAAERAGMAAFVAYGDCGTGGRLDALLEERGVARLPGAHCYAFFAGTARFDALAEDEPGTFWLTDWLARNFERLVLRGLGIDRHPELRDVYFAHYTRVVHLVQMPDPDGASRRAAEDAAAALGLPLVRVETGLAPFARPLLAGVRAPDDARGPAAAPGARVVPIRAVPAGVPRP